MLRIIPRTIQAVLMNALENYAKEPPEERIIIPTEGNEHTYINNPELAQSKNPERQKNVAQFALAIRDTSKGYDKYFGELDSLLVQIAPYTFLNAAIGCARLHTLMSAAVEKSKKLYPNEFEKVVKDLLAAANHYELLLQSDSQLQELLNQLNAYLTSFGNKPLQNCQEISGIMAHIFGCLDSANDHNRQLEQKNRELQSQVLDLIAAKNKALETAKSESAKCQNLTAELERLRASTKNASKPDYSLNYY